MNWRGIEPPKMSSANSKSLPRGSGSIRILQSPNCPWPPVCFLWRPCASTGTVMVSRYGMRGGLRFTSTPKRRLSLATVDLDVQLALARQQQFLGLRVARVPDRRVFFLEPVHRGADLVLVAARLGLDRVRQHGFRETERAGSPARPSPPACRWSACPSAWRRRRCRPPSARARWSASCPASR